MFAEGMVAVKYVAEAKRWTEGWELHVHGVGVTQVRVLAHAERQVRDLIETMTGESADEADVEVVPMIGDLTERVQKARELTAQAKRLQEEAATEARSVARALRTAGLSVSDSAQVLGVSRGRVSQLVDSN